MADSPRQFDYIVLGSGIAGLTFALKVAHVGTVAIVTKKSRAESNTNYAQGGIAAVTSEEDSFESHVQDTLVAGAGLCNEEVVRGIVEAGPERIVELIELGMKFSERENGNGERELDLGREEATPAHPHAKDVTGREIERALLESIAANENIQVFENHFAVDLITTRKLGQGDANRCVGVYVLDNQANAVETYSARTVILATGGCGKVYLYTSNPDIATGDGAAMAYRTGATIANMEFVQFHPTCLYHPKAKSFLISEAVRGEGGELLNLGESFMEGVHPLKSLAPRDIVARAIDSEMKRSGDDHVLLDITHKPARTIIDRFPNIYQTCLRFGLDITKEPIPDRTGRTLSMRRRSVSHEGETGITGLYAVGEVSCTGLHGANRLASNSCRGAGLCTPCRRTMPWQSRSCAVDIHSRLATGDATDADEMVVVSHNWDELRRMMWDYVGIVRTTKRLKRALSRVKHLQEEIQEYYWDFTVTSDLLELRNLATVAELIVQSALLREESRGLHYTLDYPEPVESFAQRNTLVARDNKEG